MNWAEAGGLGRGEGGRAEQRRQQWSQDGAGRRFTRTGASQGCGQMGAGTPGPTATPPRIQGTQEPARPRAQGVYPTLHRRGEERSQSQESVPAPLSGGERPDRSVPQFPPLQSGDNPTASTGAVRIDELVPPEALGTGPSPGQRHCQCCHCHELLLCARRSSADRTDKADIPGARVSARTRSSRVTVLEIAARVRFLFPHAKEDWRQAGSRGSGVWFEKAGSLWPPVCLQRATARSTMAAVLQPSRPHAGRQEEDQERQGHISGLLRTSTPSSQRPGLSHKATFHCKGC